MLRISNVAIGIKLAAMSTLGILLVIGMIVVQLTGNAQVRSADQVANIAQENARDVTSAEATVRSMQLAVGDIRLASTQNDLQRSAKDMADRYQSTHRLLEPLTERMRSPENRARIQKVKQLTERYVGFGREIATLRTSEIDLIAKSADATQLNKLNADIERLARERMLPIAAQIDTLIQETVATAHKLAERELAVAAQEMASSERLGIVIGVIVALVLLGTAVFGSISIARPLKALTNPVNELAAGNFSVAVDGVGRGDEIGQIATAMSAMVTRIRSTISEVKSSAREVTNASAEISTSTTDLSQRTEEQAASLEETSAAMEELAATVRRNAENAQNASETAGDTREVADRGGQVVAEAVTAMARIEDSSRKIADIIGVIDEIARQTNLLALNAAVEAARAGDAGRGFAVVASEVRSLAQRSSQAAKDIKDLIISSNSQVKDGVKLVNQAGSALQEIVGSIRKVAEVVSEIASASTEQATGLDQISKALAQMDEVTQQNSALVEENAATAKTLEDQAKSMDEQVAFFHVEATLQPAMEPGVAAPAARSVAKAASKQAPAPALTPAPAAASVAAPRVPAARKPGAAVRQAGGPVGRMQSALAVAIQDEADWKEF